MGHDAWMRLALEVAAQAGDDVPVGAVVVREGEEIASAHNRREKDNAPFAHAELLANPDYRMIVARGMGDDDE